MFQVVPGATGSKTEKQSLSVHPMFGGAGATATTALNSPQNGAYLESSFINFTFTGTSSDGSTLEFLFEIDTVDTFDSTDGGPLFSDNGGNEAFPSGTVLNESWTAPSTGAYYWRVRGTPTSLGATSSWSPIWSITVAIKKAVTKTAAYAVKTSTTQTLAAAYAITTLNPYSRESTSTLPTDNANLSTIYSGTEQGHVNNGDGTYIDQAGVASGYVLHQFKLDFQNNTQPVHVRWTGKTTIAPSAKTVHLEIYNYATPGWEAIASDSATAANTDFTLDGVSSGTLTDYYGTSDEVSARVYQS